MAISQSTPRWIASSMPRRPPFRSVAERRQRDQRDGGVVDVGIGIIGVFERPAAGLHLGQLHRPVAGNAHLPVQQPFAPPSRPLRGCASSTPASSKASSVSIVSQTGLLVAWMKVASPTSTRQPGSLSAVEPLGHHRMVERVAFDMQRHQAVNPWRLDAAPAAVGVLMADDPFQHVADGGAAPQAEPRLWPNSCKACKTLSVAAEEAVPAAGVGLLRQVVIEFLAPAGKQRVEAVLRRQRPARPARRQHGDRHQRRARPLREMIDR